MTIASLWHALSYPRLVEDALEWPPDLFALVDRALEASEAYRFVVSPPPGAVLSGVGGAAAATAADAWWRWLDGTSESPPDEVIGWWKVVRDAMDVRVEELSAGGPWDVVEAFLALHAVADEACAGLGSAIAVAPGPGCGFRAAARELLAETGSLSRLSPAVLRVLPRARVSATGISVHSLSRHVCVRDPRVEVEWHRMLARPAGVTLPEQHANVLLLPWPMRVRARDFRPVAHALPHMDAEAFGFFEFRPDETLELALVEGALRAAEDEASAVDIVMLPEAAITPDEIASLETLLSEHGVWCLIAGVRDVPEDKGVLGASWVHVGVRQEMVWRHASQHKHHRWCLDGRQIGQYHLGGVLSPKKRWWEAVTVPPRSLQIIDFGVMSFAPLLCEDLARLEPVSDLVRSIGPTLVVTLLLDGPQLASRWTARYASVLADDPGSAVCTLSSYGMVRRCRPPNCPPSRVVALWKDASGTLTEIALEDGADAVLIATNVAFGDSHTADGRRHQGTTSELTLVSVQALHADTGGGSHAAEVHPHEQPQPRFRLDERELSKATSWGEAVAEAAVAGPEYVEEVLRLATAGDWRARLGLRPPPAAFEDAVDALRRELPHAPTLESLLAAASRLRRSTEPTAMLTGTLVGTALEQRVFAEVQAGRMASGALALLAAR